jgi:hypothetical protein
MPYYKIKYGRISAWTLEQAAYLCNGQNPENPCNKIEENGSNLVSHYYVWLSTKVAQGKIVPPKTGETTYNSGTILRAMKLRYKEKCDDDIMACYICVRGNGKNNIKTKQKIIKSIFRRAGEIVFQQYPNAIIPDVAKYLTALPTFYNSPNNFRLPNKQAHQIEPLLKNIKKFPLTKKQKETDIPEITADINEIIDLM